MAALTAQCITCPNCDQPVRLDEALRHQLAADLIARTESELRQRFENQTAEKIRAALDGQLAKLDEQDERLAELTAKVRQQQEAEKEFRRRQRELEDQKDAWEVERERMRDAIRGEERELAAKVQSERYEEQARHRDEDYKTEVRQLQDKIERINAQLEEALRRGATGARQEEGFARQDVFAAQLRERFPEDEVTVTARGQAVHARQGEALLRAAVEGLGASHRDRDREPLRDRR